MERTDSFEMKRGERGIVVTMTDSFGHKTKVLLQSQLAARLGHELLRESRIVDACMDGEGNVSHDFLGDTCMRCKLVLSR